MADQATNREHESSTSRPARPRSLLNLVVPSSLDDIARAATLFIGLTYVLGVIVVVLQQALYGVWAIEIVKPRAFGAGTLLVVGTATSLFLARRYLPSLLSVDDGNPTLPVPLKIVVGELADFLGACFFVALSAHSVLSGSPTSGYGHREYAALFATLVLYLFIPRRRPDGSSLRMWLSSLAVLVSVIAALLYARGLVASLVFWFSIVSIHLYAAVNVGIGLWSGRREPIAVTALLTSASAIVVIFAGSVYENIAPSFGGGRPPQVVVHLNTDPPYGHQQRSMEMFLLDENDRGLYLIESRSMRRAIFLPRSSVALVEYQPDSLTGSDRVQTTSTAGGVDASTAPSSQCEP